MGVFPEGFSRQNAEHLVMTQILSNPMTRFSKTSNQAIAAFTLAVGALTGRIITLISAGPTSMTVLLSLLAMSVFAVAMGTEELCQGRKQLGPDDVNMPVAKIGQRVGLIQSAIGIGLIALALM